MMKCFRCSRKDDEVRLFDGLYGMESVKVCERCSLIENMPLIKTHNSDEINSRSHQTVRQRLSKMAGLEGDRKEKSISEKLKDLDEQPELEKPENINFKLIENFHWHVMRERRRRCLSQKQLAEAIRENEEVIKMIEKNALPKGALQIIQKLERCLGIKLIKNGSSIKEEVVAKPKELLPAFKDKDLPAPFIPVEDNRAHLRKMEYEEAEDMLKIAIKEETNPVVMKKEQVAGTPLKLVDFKRHGSEEVRIADLKRMQERVELDSPKKDLIQIGKEQTDDFGKEKEVVKKAAYGSYGSSVVKKDVPKKVPSIYDLMKVKQERDKELVGREIDLAHEEKDKI